MQTPKPQKKSVMISIPEDVLKEVDERKIQEDRSRSGIIVRSLKRYLNQTNLQTT